MKARRTANLSDSVHRRLNMYALAASAAGVGILALAQPAEAKIVYTPAPRWVSLRNLTYYLDLNHDGLMDFELVDYTAIATMIGVYAKGSNQIKGGTSFGYAAAALRAGDRIGPSKKFAPWHRIMLYAHCLSNSCYRTSNRGPWDNGGKGFKNHYLGLKFFINGKAHYGWARLSVTVAHLDMNVILTGYAYETIPNKPIIAGKTKGADVITLQEGTLGHLARGASAIPAWRGTN
jgi:hypothetical protein